jgi:predicted metalloenzyme YecM
MTSSFAALRSALPEFGEKLSAYMHELGIYEQSAGLAAEHIGLRLADPVDVESLKAELDKTGRCISSAIVNGREILLYQLVTPFIVGA